MPEHTADKIIGSIIIPAVLALVVLLLLYPIAAAVLSAIATADATELADWFTLAREWMLLRSILIAALLALGGLLLGLPLGAILGNARLRGSSALLLAPIWLPSILVYASFNLLRSPDSIIGKVLIEMAANDQRWAPIWAGYLLAAAGLMLWVSPIAAVLLAAGRTDRTGNLAGQLALEPVGGLTKLKLWLGARRGELLRVWGILTVIFLGSAVPLHLAQFETWSIVLWRELSQRGPDDWGMVWIGSTPMLLAACLGAWLVVRTITNTESSTTRTLGVSVSDARIPKPISAAAWCVWTLAVVVPMLGMLWSLDDLGSIKQFWHVQGSAFAASVGVAAWAMLVSVIVAICTAYMLSHPSKATRLAAKLSVYALAVLGLVPGVLVGAAVASSSIEGYLAVVLAACIRTACVGAIIGAVVSGAESGSQRAMRWVEGSTGFTAWIRTVLVAVWIPILGSGLAAGMLALYEIEASVMVRPPGMDNLPQQLLSDLHYARLEQLSAAGVNLLGLGVLFGLAATLCFVRFGRTKSNRASLGE